MQVLDTRPRRLGYVARTLNKPGDIVRNELAGRPGSAFKMITPFSESLGLATEKEYMSGRQRLHLRRDREA